MAGTIDQHIANMEAQIALPRKNGELVFDSPWEARAFGLAVALNENGLYPWRDFSQELATEIATAEQRGISSSYYERWLASLEKLVIAQGTITREELDAWTARQAQDEQDDHHHHHDGHQQQRHAHLYDRQLLLGGAKRNAVLDLWELQRYGIDCYGDANYVSIYGMRPADWHARGVRLLGRTAVECTRDGLGDAIGTDVAAVAATAPATAGSLVIDPFAGSGNTLYWLLRHLPGALGLGFELDAAVCRLTQGNLAALGLPIDVRNIDYQSGLTEASVAPDHLLITFIAPPWGDALDKTYGLDLRRTTPPITEIVDFLLHRFRHNQLLCGIQVFETVDPGSLAELKARFDWSGLHVYSLNAPGENHGILLGTKGWTP